MIRRNVIVVYRNIVGFGNYQKLGNSKGGDNDVLIRVCLLVGLFILFLKKCMNFFFQCHGQRIISFISEIIIIIVN